MWFRVKNGDINRTRSKLLRISARNEEKQQVRITNSCLKKLIGFCPRTIVLITSTNRRESLKTTINNEFHLFQITIWTWNPISPAKRWVECQRSLGMVQRRPWLYVRENSSVTSTTTKIYSFSLVKWRTNRWSIEWFHLVCGKFDIYHGIEWNFARPPRNWRDTLENAIKRAFKKKKKTTPPLAPL